MRTIVIAIACGLLAGACKTAPTKHDTPPVASVPAAEAEAWVKLEHDTRAKVVQSQKALGDLKSALHSTPAPREDELLEPLVVRRLLAKLDGHASELAELGAMFDAARATIVQAREKHDTDALRAAVTSTTADYTKIATRADALDKALAEYRHELEEAVFRPDVASRKKGAELNFSEIDFKPGAADIDMSSASSKAALGRLVGFAKRCDALTFEIHGHTSRSDAMSDGGAVDMDKLSLGRADAVKRALMSRGVKESAIALTKGVGSASDLLPEPAPDSAEAKATSALELEQIRSTNRRIEIDVVTPCP